MFEVSQLIVAPPTSLQSEDDLIAAVETIALSVEKFCTSLSEDGASHGYLVSDTKYSTSAYKSYGARLQSRIADLVKRHMLNGFTCFVGRESSDEGSETWLAASAMLYRNDPAEALTTVKVDMVLRDPDLVALTAQHILKSCAPLLDCYAAYAFSNSGWDVAEPYLGEWQSSAIAWADEAHVHGPSPMMVLPPVPLLTLGGISNLQDIGLHYIEELKFRGGRIGAFVQAGPDPFHLDESTKANWIDILRMVLPDLAQ